MVGLPSEILALPRRNSHACHSEKVGRISFFIPHHGTGGPEGLLDSTPLGQLFCKNIGLTPFIKRKKKEKEHGSKFESLFQILSFLKAFGKPVRHPVKSPKMMDIEVIVVDRMVTLKALSSTTLTMF